MRTLGKKEEEQGMKNLVMATKNGIIKKTPLEEFKNIRRSGLNAISLRKGDELKNVQKTTGQDDIIMVTKKGQAIRFNEKELRAMGRTASGIKGIRLRKGDEVVGLEVVRAQRVEEDKKKAKNHLLIITENGFGKKTNLEEYKKQGRGGSGIKTANVTQKTGDIKAIKVLEGDEEDLIVISRKGQVIRTKVSQISELSRSTQGVRLMKLDKSDKIASAACL